MTNSLRCRLLTECRVGDLVAMSRYFALRHVLELIVCDEVAKSRDEAHAY